MGIIHLISFDRRRCCSISGYRNVLISMMLELLTLGTRTRQYLRDGSFNLKGGGEGVMAFLIKKYSDSQCCLKKYSDFGGGKKII